MVDVKTWLKLFPDGMVIYAPHTGVAQLSAQAPKSVLRNASQQSADSGVATMNVADTSSGQQGAAKHDVASTVSAASHAANADVLPSKGSSGRGPGAVTIYANAGHVYMSILGHFFGTSFANPGGGAGWFNGSARPGFVVVHVPFSSLHMSKRQLKHFLRMAAMRRAATGGGSSSG